MIAIDPLGVIMDPPETEGGEPIALSGWHVNITTDGLAERPDLAPYVVTPSRLRQEWSRRAEDPQITVALKFTDEAEANAVLGLE